MHMGLSFQSDIIEVNDSFFFRLYQEEDYLLDICEVYVPVSSGCIQAFQRDGNVITKMSL